MYCAWKWEEYGPGACGKLFAKGLSAVRYVWHKVPQADLTYPPRRDNALIISDTVKTIIKMMFNDVAPRADIIQACGKAAANIHNSAVMAYSDRTWDGKLSFQSFVQSAGISKALDDYDTDNAAVAIARQMLAENRLCGIGRNSRVSFVVVAPASKDTRRAEQVLLPSAALAGQVPLDVQFYITALCRKLSAMISILYAEEERSKRRVRTLTGEVIEQEPATAAERARLLGEASAEKAIMAAYRAERLMEAPGKLRQAAPVAKSGVKRKAGDAKGQASISRFFGQV
jgi:hypothetical protein